MRIEIDDLSRPEVHALLNEHLQSMHELSPPESVHALDLEKLRAPGITFWSAWDGSQLVGCGALKELDARHGEVKSMRTPSARRRQGVGRQLVGGIMRAAGRAGARSLFLEVAESNAAARALYARAGFVEAARRAGYYQRQDAAAEDAIVLGADLTAVAAT